METHEELNQQAPQREEKAGKAQLHSAGGVKVAFGSPDTYLQKPQQQGTMSFSLYFSFPLISLFSVSAYPCVFLLFSPLPILSTFFNFNS